MKRILATIIDLTISIIPCLILNLKTNYNLIYLSYMSLLLLIIHTSVFIFIMKRTFGEKIVRIQIDRINSNEIKSSYIFLRNVVFCFYFLLIIMSYSSLIDLIVILLLFISLNTTIFFKNQYNKPMTIIDFIFKTYYKYV
ncbi:MAG: RDD family protein [Calditrichaceae bacterium]|nr:RDD family protein [Calditrichaceae bacterium]MBN2709316.1 RDD family protein [Calditrichaceae bacterium]